MKQMAVVVCLLVLTACKTQNQAPQITKLTATPDSVAVGGTSILKAVATDADNDSVSFTWQAAAGSLSPAVGDSTVWTAPQTEGIYSVSVVASDGHASDARNAPVKVGKVPRLLVAGYAHYTESWTFLLAGCFVQLFSDPLATTVTASVNGRQLPPYTTPGPYPRMFWDTLLPIPGTTQTLDVQSNMGHCAATCTIPGGFAYVTPTRDTLPVRTTLVTSWTTASNAHWYQVYVYYSGYDTTWWSKETLFVVTATNAAVPGSWFNRDGYAYLCVFAGNGPSPDPAAGAPGNVSGDGKGRWVGLNSIEKDLTVGTGGCRLPARHMRDPQRLLSCLMKGEN